jgi:hypothetical protein
LLTGELPLGRFAAPSEKAGTDPRLDTIVFRTLEKERERRFQTATAMQTEVETVANTPRGTGAAAARLSSGLHRWRAEAATAQPAVRVLLLLTVICGWEFPRAELWVLPAANDGDADHRLRRAGRRGPRIFGEKPAAPAVAAPPVAGKGRGEFSRAALAGIILAAIGIPFIAVALIAMGLIIPRALAAHHDFGVRSTWAFSSVPVVVGLFGLLPGHRGDDLRLEGNEANPRECGWVARCRLRDFFRVALSELAAPDPLPRRLCRLFSVAGTFVGLLLGILATVWLWRLQSDRITDSGAPRPLLWPWALGLALLVAPPGLIIGGLILPYLQLQRPISRAFSGTPLADVVTTENAPFIARLPEGTVELVGVSHHPSKGERWWRMDGVPIVGEAYLNSGAQVSASPGQRGYEFVFRMNNLPPDATLVTWQIANSFGWATGNAPELASAPGKALPDHQTIAATLPATLRATDIRIGFGFGEWATVFGSGQGGPGGTNPMHDGVRWQLGWSAPLETKNGEDSDELDSSTQPGLGDAGRCGEVR